MPKLAAHKNKKDKVTSVHTGSGAKAKPKRGVALSLNHVLAAVFIVIFGGIGVYLLVSSFADTCTKTATSKCTVTASKTATPAKAATTPATKQTTAKSVKPAQSIAKSDKSTTTTNACKTLANGACTNGTYKCNTGYTLSGGNTNPVCNKTPTTTSTSASTAKTCTTVTGGQQCTVNGVATTTCSTGYFLQGNGCTKVSCTKVITGGHSCNNGTVSCSSGYIQRDTVCAKADSSDGCISIQNGKACKTTTTCNYGYKAAKNSNGTQHCELDPTVRVTCTKISNGEKCNNNTINCNNGYIQSGTDCKKANTSGGCYTIQNGKACDTGAICNAGYYGTHTANGSVYCAKVSANNCISVSHGQKCGSNVVCVTGYQPAGATCVQSTPGTNCKNIDHGNTCSGLTNCDAGYQAASTVAGSAYCAVRKVTQTAGSTCVGIANGQKCTDNKTKKQTATCAYGYQAANDKAGAAYCAPSVCTQISNGAKCGYVLTCLQGYIKSADGKACVSSGSCNVSIANGKQCKDGSVICVSGYAKTADKLGQATCKKETITIPSGTVCNSAISNGRLCTEGGKTVTVCAEGYTAAVVQTGPQAGNPYCAINSCTPTVHGNQCGKTLICVDNFVKDTKGTCVPVTCKAVTGGKSCSDGAVSCSSGYFKKTSNATSCTKVTTTRITGGTKTNQGTITCKTGYKLASDKKSCVINNATVVAYSGYNDGCGGTATHYAANRKTHVTQKNYGKDSICRCNNGTTVAYGKDGTPMNDNKTIKACSSVDNTRTTTGGHSGSTTGSSHSTSTGKVDKSKVVATTSTCGKPAAGLSDVTVYCGNADGCGDYGTHYASDGKTHVGKNHDGNKSTCVCNNGLSTLYSHVNDLNNCGHDNCNVNGPTQTGDYLITKVSGTPCTYSGNLYTKNATIKTKHTVKPSCPKGTTVAYNSAGGYYCKSKNPGPVLGPPACGQSRGEHGCGNNSSQSSSCSSNTYRGSGYRTNTSTCTKSSKIGCTFDATFYYLVNGDGGKYWRGARKINNAPCFAPSFRLNHDTAVYKCNAGDATPRRDIASTCEMNFDHWDNASY